MNMNDDIFTRLQNGEKPEAIAKEYTDALNSAIKKYEEEKEAAEALSNKIADTSTLLENIKDYAYCYYKDFAKHLDEIDPTELIELFDSIAELLPLLEELKNIGTAFEMNIPKKEENKKKDHCCGSQPCSCHKADPLESFLKAHNLFNI